MEEQNQISLNTNKKSENNNEVNFEDTMKKLEEIANELENGKLDLDTSVTKFEEGMKLSKKCNEILENAEKRISTLIKDKEELKEENFVLKED